MQQGWRGLSKVQESQGKTERDDPVGGEGTFTDYKKREVRKEEGKHKKEVNVFRPRERIQLDQMSHSAATPAL